MHRLRLAAAIGLCFGLPFAAPLKADDPPKHEEAHESDGPATLEAAIETDHGENSGAADGDTSVTHGTVEIDGQDVAYTATAGTLPLKGENDKARANVFYIAYTRDGVDASKRPVTFTFNGGPGSSSVWLHLGLMGPRRVALPDDAEPAPPPHRLVPNHHSLLDVTDIVLIDPVSTGYSRPEDEKQKGEFHGYTEDIRSVGEFIHLYLTRNARWGSRKYLMGESYGTLRAAGLSGHLQDRYGMELNGIVLVSSVLDFQTLSFGRDNDLPYVLFLPAYTATAWYHDRLPRELQRRRLRDVLDLAERFARGSYADALLRGDAMPRRRRRRVVRDYAWLTGLDRRFVEKANLRVTMSQFAKRLLEEEERIVGRFDGRYEGPQLSGTAERAEYDPSAAAIFGPYTSAMNDYLRTELKVERDEVYEILTSKVHPWSYDDFENRYVTATSTLREAMTKNPYLKLFVANGYYDLATPYFASEYTFDHMHLPAGRRENVRMGYYEAGHMMYVHEPSLRKLRRDLLEFYAEPRTE